MKGLDSMAVSDMNSSIELMRSADYKERFVAEYIQLRIRTEKLAEMVRKYKAGTLDFTPKCSVELLEDQLRHMQAYLTDLEVRAGIEMIDIPTEF
jgi:hypothetical protein